MLLGSIRTFGDVDFSFAQVVTLYMLDDVGEPTIKQVAETLGRSVSATSRLLDQLVERGLIGRREDKQDRRAKRVFLKEEGWTFLRTFEQNRADAQLALMVYLAPEEQAQVAQAMALLAEAARRHSQTDTYNAKPGATAHEIMDD
jgi:DNA-binding MarR family transcriptional regulator